MGEHDQHTAEHYRQDENCDDKAEVLAEGHYRVATEHETCDDGDQAEDEKNSELDARNSYWPRCCGKPGRHGRPKSHWHQSMNGGQAAIMRQSRHKGLGGPHEVASA